LLHVSALNNDYYHFDTVNHCLQGERYGMTYQLGDRVEIIVSRVNLDDRKIDFDLAEGFESERKARKRLPRRKEGGPDAARSKKGGVREKLRRGELGKGKPKKGAKPKKDAKAKPAPKARRKSKRK
jgi:ribonuclease R